jgi:putative ABC transport system permease protein
MINNYIKTTFRNLWKTKGYSLLNIGGLAIGIACAALIFLWVEDELTFNHYFSNKDMLYKVKDRQTYNGTTFTFDATPGPLAQGMKSEIAGIKNTARSSWSNRVLFSINGKEIYQQGSYVDSSFFSMFHLDFIKGDPAHAFDQLYTIVLSETMAMKFFETTDIVGKTLTLNNKKSYVVTGVIKDLPKNISFQFDWLSPFKIFEDENPWLMQWGNNGIVTYAETDANANISNVNKKLDGYVETKYQEASARMSIYPMNRWRLYDSYDNGKEIQGRIKYVNLFSLIAWVILVIACINFMNLATARSEKRAKEVGVRKVLGVSKFKLIEQFIGESLIMSFISTFLSIGLIYLFLPAFNSLVEKELSVDILNPMHIGAMMVISLLCGLIAGSYPAFYLSSFNPIGVLKGLKLKSSSGVDFIRKGLVVLQFVISVTFIISTIIIYQQIQHIKDRNLGYNKEGLVYLNLTGNMKTNFEVIRNDLQQTGVVKNAALSTNMVLQLGNNSSNFSWEGKDPNKQVLVTVEAVTPGYISTMDMQLKEGHDFYPELKANNGYVIINEAMAKIVNNKNIIGSVISRGDGSRNTVVGVMKDFLYNDMYSTGAPLILFCDTSSSYYINYLTLRLTDNANLPTSLAQIENVIKRNNPGYPVEYKFVDDTFSQLFTTETLIGKLSGIFSLLAILISCMGLFGLSAYTAEKRTKEIGIRKVLGASTSGLAGLLSKDFIKLVAISCLIAFPIAWWMMKNWLDSYAYKINISWTVFATAGILALIIAMITVSFQAVKAAVSNPVKSIQTE